jgi:hypothetical protein
MTPKSTQIIKHLEAIIHAAGDGFTNTEDRDYAIQEALGALMDLANETMDEDLLELAGLGEEWSCEWEWDEDKEVIEAAYDAVMDKVRDMLS